MLSTRIKEATKASHLQLEKHVVSRLKAIRHDQDYADLLKHFYAYFYAVEQAIAPYVTPGVLPDYAERRKSSYLKSDIESLNGNVDHLPQVTSPTITSVQDALGALYVMEGSIMGGSIIVQMLAKHGVQKGVSFFSGYGEQTGEMWAKFIQALNTVARSEAEEDRATAAANETFGNFAKLFEASKA